MTLIKFSLSFFILALVGLISYAQPPSINWQRCYGGSDLDFGTKVIEGYSNTIMLAGYKRSIDGDMIYSEGGGYDYYWFLLDSLGGIINSKTFGGIGDDFLHDLSKATVGNSILVGSSNSSELAGIHGGFDVFVVKIGFGGNTIWEKCFGGSGDDIGYSVVNTHDSCFAILGSTYSSDGDVAFNHGTGTDDYWLIKIDQSGNLLWEKTFGGSDLEDGSKIIETSDGGFLLCGTSFSSNGQVTGNHGSADYWCVKTDSLGNLQWEKSYGGSSIDALYNAIEVENKFYMFGYQDSQISGDISFNHVDTVGTASIDAWLVCIDSIGNLLWERSYGGTVDDIGQDLTYYNNTLFLGCSSSSHDWDVTNLHSPSSEYWLLQTDMLGNIIWQNCYGGTSHEFLNSICIANGNLYATGYALSNNGNVSGNHGDRDFWLLSLGLNFLINNNNELKNTTDFTVYPNPANNFVTFSVEEGLTIDHIIIYDLIGKLVKKIAIDNEDYSIDVSDLEDGVYVLNIYTDDTTNLQNKKILIINQKL